MAPDAEGNFQDVWPLTTSHCRFRGFSPTDCHAASRILDQFQIGHANQLWRWPFWGFSEKSWKNFLYSIAMNVRE